MGKEAEIAAAGSIHVSAGGDAVIGGLRSDAAGPDAIVVRSGGRVDGNDVPTLATTADGAGVAIHAVDGIGATSGLVTDAAIVDASSLKGGIVLASRRDLTVTLDAADGSVTLTGARDVRIAGLAAAALDLGGGVVTIDAARVNRATIAADRLRINDMEVGDSLLLRSGDIIATLRQTAGAAAEGRALDLHVDGLDGGMGSAAMRITAASVAGELNRLHTVVFDTTAAQVRLQDSEVTGTMRLTAAGSGLWMDNTDATPVTVDRQFYARNGLFDLAVDNGAVTTTATRIVLPPPPPPPPSSPPSSPLPSSSPSAFPPAVPVPVPVTVPVTVETPPAPSVTPQPPASTEPSRTPAAPFSDLGSLVSQMVPSAMVAVTTPSVTPPGMRSMFAAGGDSRLGSSFNAAVPGGGSAAPAISPGGAMTLGVNLGGLEYGRPNEGAATPVPGAGRSTAAPRQDQGIQPSAQQPVEPAAGATTGGSANGNGEKGRAATETTQPDADRNSSAGDSSNQKNERDGV